MSSDVFKVKKARETNNKTKEQHGTLDCIHERYIEELQQKTKPSSSKSSSVIKYRKNEHQYWVGRGPKPGWVKDVEKNGESIEQYRVPV